ncbi:hypothetical protein Gotur_011540 [Gossypium turneri]
MSISLVVLKTSRINLGYRLGFSCVDRIFWYNRIFLTLGPNWLLGRQNRNRHFGSYSGKRITFGKVITWKC